MNQKEQIIQKLETVIGQYKQDKDETIFKDCPFCGNDRKNFCVNVVKNAVHCWCCSYHGSIIRLFRDLKIPYDFTITFEKKKEVPKNEKDEAILPEDAVELDKTDYRWMVMKYLNSRGLNEGDVKKYHIMWCEKLGRILFPFYDLNGNLIFWNARTIYKSVKPKYLHASVSKSTRILMYEGESKETFIVEGVFDGIAVNKLGKNAIMLMGSSVSEDLKTFLRVKKIPVVICLDSDMTDKQMKVERELKMYLGKDMVTSLYLKGKDASESGIDGETGLIGYIKRKMR